MNVLPGAGLAPIMGVGVVAILFPVFVLAVFFGFIILLRYIRYKENMMMIQRGIAPDAPQMLPGLNGKRQLSQTYRLRSGIITCCVGIALFFGLLTMGVGPWLLGGLIPFAYGTGELLTLVILSPGKDKKPFDPTE